MHDNKDFPKKGDKYYMPKIMINPIKGVSEHIWKDSHIDRGRYKLNLVYPTASEAYAAADKMLYALKKRE